MERRRGSQRGDGHGLMVLAGLALVSFLGMAGGAVAGAVEAPVPVVTIEAVQDGFVVVDGVRPCSNVSSATDQPAQLVVRRTGSTDVALTVHYAAQPSAGGENDYEPLTGTVTIPAGETAAPIVVIPKFVDQPAPIHVHRSSSLRARLLDAADYDVGADARAAVVLRFDIAVFECVPAPVVPATSPPTTPTTAPPAAAPAAQPSESAAPGTLPLTGAPLAATLAGTASALLASGFAAMRYGRPRRLRIRAGWR